MVVSPKIVQFSVFKLIFIILRVFAIFARKRVVEGSFFRKIDSLNMQYKNNYCAISRFHDHLKFEVTFIAILGIEANIFNKAILVNWHGVCAHHDNRV